MFERFTEQARQIVVKAQDEARELHHTYIGTEHLLLGMLLGEGIAHEALTSLGVTYEQALELIKMEADEREAKESGQIPLTPRAKKVLELSLREALSLGHNHIGTEHVLLGLVRENEGEAKQVLLQFDADAEAIRNKVLMLLGYQENVVPRDRSRAPTDIASHIQEIRAELNALVTDQAIDQEVATELRNILTLFMVKAGEAGVL